MKELFNEGWLFMANPIGEVWDADYDTSGFESVTLPHDWQITRERDSSLSGSQGYYPHDGKLAYIKKFHAGKELSGKAVELIFDGAQRFSQVYVNGILAGGRRYGYVPFKVDMTKYLRIGEENTICVTLDNSDSGDRWYSGEGIYRNVWLSVTEMARISPWGVRTTHTMSGDNAHIDIVIDIENTGEKRDIEVKFSLCGNEVTVFGTADNNIQLHTSMDIVSPERWDILNPKHYSLKVDMYSAGELTETRSINVGFREAKFDGDTGFWLNGRNIKLYGVDLHHDGGVFGAAVPIKVWKRRFEKLREIGVNAIRTSHNPQATEFYDLCDEMGFVVIDELYDKWDGTNLYFKDVFPYDRQEDLRSMVYRDINHPSIILWSVGNEVEIQYSEPFYEYLKEMTEACRKLDPTRGVSMALISYVLKGFNEDTPLDVRLDATVRYGELVDVFMGNYMESFYEAYRAKGLRKAFIGSEILSYYRFEELSNTNLIPVCPLNDVNDKPYVAGGFVWAGVDYLGESCGWPCHGWTGCPVDSAGFIKTRGWHYKSYTTDEPIAKIAVFDDSLKWDMANGMWGFPELAADWNQFKRARVYHIGVISNCEQVDLYLNDNHVRRAKVDKEEHMAHFYVPYVPGTLRAEGINGDKVVITDALKSTEAPSYIKLIAHESGLKADGQDIMHIEAYLMDAEEQVYTRARIPVEFEVTGAAAILKTSNGDFLATDDVQRFHEGHMLLIIKSNGEKGDIQIKASALGVQPAKITVTAK